MGFLKNRQPTPPSLASCRRYFLFVLALSAVGQLGCNKESVKPVVEPDEITSAPRSNPREPADTEHPIVRIQTNFGEISLQLDAVLAPVTVRNFLNYVSEGFYNNTLFHYVLADKMVLAGGYSTDHQFKPPRFSIRNEAHNGLKNIRGTIAMARDVARVDSATSQFFINLEDAPQRDHAGDSAEDYGYCVFGKVIQGLEIADQISQASTQDLGGDLVQLPQPPIVIKTIRVVL